MKNKLLIACIMFSVQITAMKRTRHATSNTRPYKKPCTSQHTLSIQKNTFDFPSLPTDMQRIILDCATNKTSEKMQRKACYMIRTLACTSRQLNVFINEPSFSDQLINDYSYKFNNSHENIARSLKTVQATKRLNLQLELKNLCLNLGIHKPAKKLKSLIKRNVNLEFTYHHNHLSRNALMITTKHNETLFDLLLTTNMDINAANMLGWTALNIATEFPIHLDYLKKLLNCQSLTINQKNLSGSTALLNCLINRKDHRISNVFMKAIPQLLNAGADPELSNNNQYTPLDAAQVLEDEDIIDFIVEAIDKKQAQL